MNYADQKVLEFITQIVFPYYREVSEEVWKIRLNGEFIKTHKGKSTWPKEHFARSAFLNLINNSNVITAVHSEFRKQQADKNHHQNYPTTQEIKECIKQMESVGYLEFVRII